MKKTALAACLILVLAACASEQQKPAPTSTATPTGAAPAGSTTTTSPVTTQPVASNPLNDPSNILYKKSVYYGFDKYDVTPEYRPLVEAHAKYMVTHPSSTVRIEGNCDERGSREYNLALGQRRADGVKKIMELLGVPDARIETTSWGEEKPKAKGHDEAAWAENRRSDIIYTHE